MIPVVAHPRPTGATRPRLVADHSAGEVWPPLMNGDHLTQPEFHRLYEATPEDFRAELIEGVVYVSSPVRLRHHARPHGRVVTWLGTYCAATPGVDLADDATVILDGDNEVQPDALLRIVTEARGKSLVTDEDYISGPPELAVEVAASSASIDLHAKREAYRRNGVQEYLVWRVLSRAIDWWELRDGQYAPLAADATGVICSQVFPALCLDVPALLADDLAKVLATQNARMAAMSGAHQAFVAQLKPGS